MCFPLLVSPRYIQHDSTYSIFLQKEAYFSNKISNMVQHIQHFCRKKHFSNKYEIPYINVLKMHISAVSSPFFTENVLISAEISSSAQMGSTKTHKKVCVLV